MRHSDDFRRATRRGIRVGRPTLVVHAVATGESGVRVGFVVGKPVGPAVTRNRVKRRLRHLALAELEHTPAGVDVVVRALPAASRAEAGLPADLSDAWRQAIRRLEGRGHAAPTVTGRPGSGRAPRS